MPAGTESDGDIFVFASNDSDLVIDINGYFAPAGPGGLSLYPVAPCRVIDTRHGQRPALQREPESSVDVTGSFCGPPAWRKLMSSMRRWFRQAPLGYLTLWPDGGNQPGVSTLNAFDGAITSNMAIVPRTNGKIDAFASGSDPTDPGHLRLLRAVRRVGDRAGSLVVPRGFSCGQSGRKC